MRFLPFPFSTLQDTGLSFQEIIENFFYAGQLFLIIYNHQIIWDLYQKSLFKISHKLNQSNEVLFVIALSKVLLTRITYKQ